MYQTIAGTGVTVSVTRCQQPGGATRAQDLLISPSPIHPLLSILVGSRERLLVLPFVEVLFVAELTRSKTPSFPQGFYNFENRPASLSLPTHAN